MNVVGFTGRLHNDPARRETPKGVVAIFRLAVDGTRHRLWIDVECWGHLAGIVAAHLVRGRHIAVTGSLRHTQYQDRDARRREHWYVHADRISFLEPPRFDSNVTEAAADTRTSDPDVSEAAPQHPGSSVPGAGSEHTEVVDGVSTRR